MRAHLEDTSSEEQPRAATGCHCVDVQLRSLYCDACSGTDKQMLHNFNVTTNRAFRRQLMPRHDSRTYNTSAQCLGGCTPAVVLSKTCSYVPANRDTSVEVPPMSNPIICSFAASCPSHCVVRAYPTYLHPKTTCEELGVSTEAE